jgi:hypothetical protein
MVGTATGAYEPYRDISAMSAKLDRTATLMHGVSAARDSSLCLYQVLACKHVEHSYSSADHGLQPPLIYCLKYYKAIHCTDH